MHGKLPDILYWGYDLLTQTEHITVFRCFSHFKIRLNITLTKKEFELINQKTIFLTYNFLSVMIKSLEKMFSIQSLDFLVGFIFNCILETFVLLK